MKRILLLMSLVVGFAQAAFADFYEREGNYLYKYTPYTQMFSSNEGIKMTAQVAHQAMHSLLSDLVKNKVLPEQVLSRKDLEKFRQMQTDMDDMVIYLNDFIQEQRARGGAFEKVDLLPDAVMVFGGHKFSINMGKGVGASAMAGMIIMPVWATKIDMRTNQTVEEYATFRTSVVGWPSVDAGVGVGGGSRWRGGLGMIWDLNKAMVQPESFWGVGPAVSWSPVAFGFGLNAKAGILSNWEMPGWVDFAYATVAVELGAVAEIGSPRINISTIMKGEAVMGLFEKSQQDIYRSAQKIIAREIDEVMRERAGLPGANSKREESEEKVGQEEKPEIRKN